MSSQDTRRILLELAESGRLNSTTLDKALALAGITPNRIDTHRFVDRLTLVIGMLLIATGVICFFAFNWAEISRFAKFAVVVFGLTASILIARWKGLESLVGRSALGLACVLVGVLFAVSGQVYQTGADSYLLFTIWAGLILPWSIIASSPSLWVFWVVLINIAGALFFLPRLGLLQILFSADGGLWLLAALNAIALTVWEWQANYRAWLTERRGPRILVTILLVYATSLIIWWIFSKSGNSVDSLSISPIAYIACIASILTHYLLSRRDLFPLAGVCLSLIISVVAQLIELLGDTWRYASQLLLVALTVSLLTAGMAMWLRWLSRRWQEV